MNTDVEGLLREGMERFTTDLRARAGLVSWVARQRRRRLALRAVAGGAAALTAGAVALVTVIAPAARPGGTGQSAVLAAYVVNRVDTALSAVEPGEIAQLTVTRSAAVPGGKTITTTAEEWSFGEQWRSLIKSPAGHPVYDEGFGSSSVYTLVSYPTRTWAREPGLGRPAPLKLGRFAGPLFGRLPAPAFGWDAAPEFKPLLAPAFDCKPVVAVVPSLFQPGLPSIGFAALPGVGFSASTLPTAGALRSAISCGALTVAGRQRLDGINAIELTSGRNSPIAETIWVSPGTYLPVRMVVRSAIGFGGIRQTADITWLPPIAQNLAKLTVPIPAGFRQVRVPQAVLPILQLFTGGALAKAHLLCLAGPLGQGRNPCSPMGHGGS